MNRDLLEKAVTLGDWSRIKPTKTTLKAIFKKDEDDMQPSLMDVAKRYKTFHKFPKELIGENGLIWKDPDMKIEALFELAHEGAFNLVPKNLLTKEVLIGKNPAGFSLLHYLAVFDHLNTLPQALLTREELLMENGGRHIPLESAAIKIRHCRDYPKSTSNTTKDIQRLKSNISFILKRLDLKDLEKRRYDKEAYPYIKDEIKKRKIINHLRKDERNMEI